jgi:hypothetical protein
MMTTATPSIEAKPPARTDRTSRRPLHAAGGDHPAPGRLRHARWTLFSVPFKSRMADDDLARLHSSLDLATYMAPKVGVGGAASPGVVPLDFWSGLFLERGAGEAEWVLEGRTWGNPHDAAIHEWHIRAALAARELDPSVEIPVRSQAPSADSPSRPLGRAANKRLARLGRRLIGLE